jgi:mannose-6-phosphate isomerase-like protein (cupin superfamily)
MIFKRKKMARKVDKPWGHELIWAETEKYVGKILHISNGFCLSLQYHNVKDETILVQSGILTMEIREGESRKIFKMNSGDSIRIKPTIIHRMSAYDGDVDVIEVSTSELDDVIRLEDSYGRV